MVFLKEIKEVKSTGLDLHNTLQMVLKPILISLQTVVYT